MDTEREVGSPLPRTILSLAWLTLVKNMRFRTTRFVRSSLRY